MIGTIGLKSLTMRAVAVAMLLVGTLGSVRADTLIDDFSAPNPAIGYSLDGTVGSTFVRTDGNRTVTVTQTQNSFAVAGFTTGLLGNSVIGGRFNLSTGVSTTAFANLSYVFAPTLDLSGVNSSFNITVNSTDLNVPYSIVLSDGVNTSTQVGILSTPSSSLALTNFSGVNLSSVSSVEFYLNRDILTGASTPEADLSISSLSVTQAVPTPPAFLLALSVLPVLGFRRKLLKA